MKGIIYSKTIVEQGTYLNNVSMYGFDGATYSTIFTVLIVKVVSIIPSYTRYFTTTYPRYKQYSPSAYFYFFYSKNSQQISFESVPTTRNNFGEIIIIILYYKITHDWPRQKYLNSISTLSTLFNILCTLLIFSKHFKFSYIY